MIPVQQPTCANNSCSIYSCELTWIEINMQARMLWQTCFGAIFLLEIKIQNFNLLVYDPDSSENYLKT